MVKNLFITLLFFSFTQMQSQSTTEEEKIKTVIATFFDGLHKGDSTIIASVLHKDLKIQTTATDKSGKKFLRNQSKKSFLTGIANKKPEHKYFEKLLSYDIKIDGNLASVWTPYEFYFNDNFSHCGANSFQLFDNNGKWEIIYIVDMRRTENCNPSNKN